MKVNEFVRLAKAKGCYVKRHGKRHDIWYSPITGRTFSIPRHGSQELARGLADEAREVLGV